MSEPHSRVLPRRFGVALAAVPLVAVLIFDGVIVARRAAHDRTATTAHRGQSTSTLADDQATGLRSLEIRSLLAHRGHAVLHHDIREWMSTVDPTQQRFRRQQAAAFRNMQAVPFASFSYDFDPLRSLPPNPRTDRYHATVWAPEDFALRYAFSGYDPEPASLPQYPTFVRRGTQWYLASLSDYAGIGDVSSRDLWDFGPVRVIRGSRALVLGHPSMLSTMQQLAVETASDIPRVTAVWPHWSRRVVVLVPSTERELAEVSDDHGNLDKIAAIAAAEVQTQPGRPKPVGSRVAINPRNWPKLTPLGRQVVLTHELTHVATRDVTGAATPTWLAEGFADYVGYLDTGVPTTFVAQELAADVRAGHLPSSLPPDSQFEGSSKRLAQAYEEGWLACRYIAQTWGQRALVRFYRAVGTSPTFPKAALTAVTPRVLHVSFPAFVQRWRAFVRRELG